MLPIDEVLPEILASLRRTPNLVLRAPPGAGKTTRVGPAMLDAGLVPDGQRIVMLEPRRVAARASARRIAKERKSRLGGEIGFHVRFDNKTSKSTRLAIVTEGLLNRQLQADPELPGVAAVILDEFHERSIHADLALAFLREIQETLRPDLKLVVMSATLIADPIAEFLGGCPIIDSPGKMYPVDVRYLDAPPSDRARPEDIVASGVRRALTEDDDGGDLLVFLPGARDIRRSEDKLKERYGDALDVRPLYGDLTPAEQDRALDRGSRRKIVLATNIAETSLTIEGTTTVIDTGWVKMARHDPGRGIDRLDQVRISRASAKQRAGRAGRTQPGRAFRLWTESEDRRFEAHETPEIARIDLADTLLDVIAWAGTEPAEFAWFEAPPEPAMRTALSLLKKIGAVERDAPRLTELGHTLRKFPLHPRISAGLVSAHGFGVLKEGALLAALISERDIVRRSSNPARAAVEEEGPSDLLHRRDLFLDLEWSGFSRSSGLDIGAARAVSKAKDRLFRIAEKELGPAEDAPRDEVEKRLLRSLLAGFPDRVAKRRAPRSDRVVLATGRGARLSNESVVRTEPLMLAIEVDDSPRAGASGDSLVRVASAIEESWLDPAWIESAQRVRFDKNRVEAVVERRYGEIVLSEKRDRNVDPQALAEALAEEAKSLLPKMLSSQPELEKLLLRIELVRAECPDAGVPEVDLEAMLPELCFGVQTLSALEKLDWAEAVRTRLGYAKVQTLNRLAPERIQVPSGTQVKLRYTHDGPPVLAVRLQEVFGLSSTPTVADGRVKVLMELLGPNMRPVQVTSDLESFWDRTYPEVRKDLRARYPKWPWPEDGRTAPPQRRPQRRRRK